jgi:hypothetical protein
MAGPLLLRPMETALHRGLDSSSQLKKPRGCDDWP